MKRARWLVLTGVLLTWAVLLTGVSVAWGDDSVTPMCNGQVCSTAPSALWYTAPVTLTWQVSTSPAPSQTIGCSELPARPGDFVGTDSCEALWSSGDDIKRSYTVHVEISNPIATATSTRPPDSNGWYNHPVAVSFGGRAFSGIASCTPAATYAGPDALTASIAGSCTDNAGKVAHASFTLHYDATPPTITAVTPSRAPDVNGWYNRPVTFNVAGTDATSGIEGCSSPTYAGPGNANATVTGSCTDRAGNTATVALPLRYDSTAPRLHVLSSTGDHLVALRWQASSSPAPLASLEITRTSAAGGRSRTVVEHPGDGSYDDSHVSDYVRYRYTITATDQAGNVTVRRITAIPGPRLLAPRNGARTIRPPLLRWTPVRHADYYNVQLYRGHRKVLSTWPAGPRLQLHETWSFGGRRRKLKPGRYRWFVWPGHGARAGAHYGRLIGRGTFAVVARP